LKKLLKNIEKQHEVQRKKSDDYYRIALVGYTNAGKSTVMNGLTDSHVFVEGKLFATLDTTVRRIYLGNGFTALLSDTVGFIRKLPHELIASFQTTLAQIYEADLILLVVDISDPDFAEKIDVVENTLSRLNVAHKPELLLLNKVDKLSDSSKMQLIQRSYPQAIFISAKKQYRLDRVKQAILGIASDFFTETSVKIGYNDYQNVSNKFSGIAQIYNHEYAEDYIELKLRYPKHAREVISSIIDRL
jgi:GTP-binding protein HflX